MNSKTLDLIVMILTGIVIGAMFAYAILGRG